MWQSSKNNGYLLLIVTLFAVAIGISLVTFVPTFLLGILVGGLVILLSFLSSWWALYFILVINCFLLGKSELIAIPEIFYVILLLVALSGSILRAFLFRRPGYFQHSFILLILFMVFCAISFLSANFNDVSIIESMRDFGPLANYMLLFIAFESLTSGKKLRQFLIVFTVLAFGIVLRDLEYLLNIRNIINSGNILAKLFSGIGGVGYMHTLFFLSLAFYPIARKKIHRLLLLVLMSLTGLVVLLAMTRTYWIGMLFTLAVYFLYIFYKTPKRKLQRLQQIGFVAIALIMFVGTVAIIYKVDLNVDISERFGSIHSLAIGEFDYSATARLNESRTAWDLIKQSPFFGYGLGYSLIFYGKPYILSGDGTVITRFIHNSYLFFLLKTGIVGLLSFLAFLLFLFRESYNVYKRHPEPWIQALALGFILSLIHLAIISFATSKFSDWSVTLFIGIFGGFILRSRFDTLRKVQ